MFDRPVLIYSDYCIHSTNFINGLMKHPEVYEIFIRVNIDIDPATRQRPDIFYQIQNVLQYKIQEVPTVILPNAEHILTGVEAFKWLEYQLSEQNKSVELTPFNPVEMGSFSDSYSTYGSNNNNEDAKEQTFKFINKPDEPINTPKEDSSVVSKDAYSKKQQERECFDNTYFTENPSRNNANNNRTSGGTVMNNQRGQSDKKDEFDLRFQQMMNERNNLQTTKRLSNVY